MKTQSDITGQVDVQPPEDRRALERALAEALTPLCEPRLSFVEELERELVLEAERQQAKQRLLQTLGIVGGGVLTIVAGVLGYMLLCRQQKEKPAPKEALEKVPLQESPQPTSAPVPAT